MIARDIYTPPPHPHPTRATHHRESSGGPGRPYSDGASAVLRRPKQAIKGESRRFSLARLLSSPLFSLFFFGAFLHAYTIKYIYVYVCVCVYMYMHALLYAYTYIVLFLGDIQIRGRWPISRPDATANDEAPPWVRTANHHSRSGKKAQSDLFMTFQPPIRPQNYIWAFKPSSGRGNRFCDALI